MLECPLFFRVSLQFSVWSANQSAFEIRRIWGLCPVCTTLVIGQCVQIPSWLQFCWCWLMLGIFLGLPRCEGSKLEKFFTQKFLENYSLYYFLQCKSIWFLNSNLMDVCIVPAVKMLNSLKFSHFSKQSSCVSCIFWKPPLQQPFQTAQWMCQNPLQAVKQVMEITRTISPITETGFAQGRKAASL